MDFYCYPFNDEWDFVIKHQKHFPNATSDLFFNLPYDRPIEKV